MFEITPLLHREINDKWNKVKQNSWTVEWDGQLQPQASKWQIITIAALFFLVPAVILAVGQASFGT